METSRRRTEPGRRTVASFIGSGINGNNLQRRVLQQRFSVASFIGSGINGNSVVENPHANPVEVASFIGSGINGNIFGEVSILSLLMRRFFYRKWN